MFSMIRPANARHAGLQPTLAPAISQLQTEEFCNSTFPRLQLSFKETHIKSSTTSDEEDKRHPKRLKRPALLEGGSKHSSRVLLGLEERAPKGQGGSGESPGSPLKGASKALKGS